MDPRSQATRILNSIGAVLVRKRKHEVWRLPDGKNWVRSSTPSDCHSDLNNLSQLKRTTGLEEQIHKNPDRQAKKPHGGDGKRPKFQPVGQSPLADALRLTGYAEAVLQSKIEDLENQLVDARASRDHAKERLQLNQQEMDHCWGCRLRHGLRQLLSRLKPE
jgi:hypothetical protein